MSELIVSSNYFVELSSDDLYLLDGGNFRGFFNTIAVAAITATAWNVLKGAKAGATVGSFFGGPVGAIVGAVIVGSIGYVAKQILD